MQDGIEVRLGVRLPDVRSRAIVIDPELDIWMWANDAAMRQALDWKLDEPIREWVTRRFDVGFDEDGKPVNRDERQGPKELLEAVLRELRLPRSGSLYKEIARTMSLARCTDPSFVRLRETLVAWYGTSRAGG